MSQQRLLLRSVALILAGLGVSGLLAFFAGGPAAPVAEAEPAKGTLTSRPRPETAPAPPPAAGAEIRTRAGERRRVVLPDGSLLFVNENSVAKLDSPKSLALSAGEIYLETASGGLTVQAGASEVAGKQASFSVRVEKAGPAVGVTRGQVNVKGVSKALHAGQQLAAGADQPAAAPRASHALAWLRDLVCAAEAPLLPANPQAGGALVAIDPNGQEAKLMLRRFHVDVHIEDGFARTTIDQTYFNHHSEQLEGTFYFPLPADASLSRLAMYVNGQLMEGGMAERDHARNVYETIRYARRDPALLEWVDGSTFKMRVFPLEPRQEKRIILSYSQRLDALYGKMTYRFPAGHTLQKVRDWSFHARVKDGAGWLWDSPSHKLQAQEAKKDLELFGAAQDAATNRDVVLSLVNDRFAGEDSSVHFATTEHEGAKYLLMRFRPRLDGKLTAQRRDWVFLGETSGDRDPLLARVQIEVLRHLLQYAGPDDTFAVLAAGTRVKAFSKESLPLTPENVNAAIEFLEGAHLIGALDLGQALTEAAAFLKKGSNPHLVHLGSGVAAMGERRDEVLARLLPEGSRYIGVGVGRKWNRSLMKIAAERTGGHFTQINPDEPIGWRAFELLATINTPRLMDVEVLDQDGKATFLVFNQAVAQGEEIAAVTRVVGDAASVAPGQKATQAASPTLPKTIVIRGTVDGKKRDRVLFVKNTRPGAGYLPRTWAKLEIDRLLADDPVKHKDTIVALSKSMYVITPFTSLLVLENEDQYVQYRVDRGRKAHWALYPCPSTIPVVVEPDPDAIEAKAGKLPSKKVLQTIAGLAPSRRVNSPPEDLANEVAELTRGIPEPRATELARALTRPISAVAGGPERIEERLLPQFRNIGWSSTRDLGSVSSFNLGVSRLSPTAGGIPRAVANQFANRNDPNDLKNIALRPSTIGAGFKIGAGYNTDNGLVGSIVLAGSRHGTNESGMAFVISSGHNAVGVRLNPALSASGFASLANALVDVFVIPRGARGSQAHLLLRNVRVLATDVEMRRDDSGAFGQAQIATLALTPQEALQVTLARESGALQLVPRRAYFPSGSNSDAAWENGNDGAVYARPIYLPPADIFHDLVAYAPGLNSSISDVLAVLDSEAVAEVWNKPGKIDPAAKALFDRVKRAGWRSLDVPAQAGRPAFTILFDDNGHVAYERILPIGLRERVVCDAKTVTHVYPQLGLAARRNVSRHHRAELAALVPWFVPPADELARGADLKLVGERAVAIVPHSVAALQKDVDGNTPTYNVVHLVFDKDGGLAERRVVQMPSGDVVNRLTLSADGTARLLDGKDKELSVWRGKLGKGKAPGLTADTKDLLVLPLPYRTAEHVQQALKLQKRGTGDLTLNEALPLFLAHVARGDGSAADQLFRQVFHAREQRQMGYYVLLASCGVNLDSDHGNVLAEHIDNPLAQYLALHTSPVLRKHASQWAVGSGSWQDGFLQHLAVTHALLQRWQEPKLLKGDPARAAAETRRAIDYVEKNKDSLFGWALLSLIQDRAADDAALHDKLAELWPLFETHAGLSFAARYETARSLWKAGKKDEAAKRFRALYEAAVKDDALPAVDADMRAALLAGDAWGDMLRQTARKLALEKRRPAILAIARQCWDLDDQPLAGELMATALDGIVDADERTAMALAAFDMLRDTAQLPEADRLLQGLLADPKLARQGLLWRLASELARQRDMDARAVECLEKALEIEAERPPEVIDLEVARTDYGTLLTHYQGLADAMVALKIAPAADFRSRVIRAADRWRAVDTDPSAACEAAARVLKRLGDRELAWDYLTTPVALRPNESGPWLGLAATLGKQGELELADRAYRAAAAAEPTDPQIMWDRGQNLKQMGKHQEAQLLVRQIAVGAWQPRFQGLQSQAKHLLKRE